MLILQNITYIHPNGDVLFSDVNFAVNSSQKTALIGNNGTGKSTMLRIMAGIILPSGGHVHAPTNPYYTPKYLDSSTISLLLKPWAWIKNYKHYTRF